MDPVQRRVLVQVHLDQGPVVQQVPGGHVRHVAAALNLLQEVVHLPPALLVLGTGAGSAEKKLYLGQKIVRDKSFYRTFSFSLPLLWAPERSKLSWRSRLSRSRITRGSKAPGSKNQRKRCFFSGQTWKKTTQCYYLVSEDGGFGQALEQVPLLRDHVGQLVHLGLEEGDLFGRLNELAVILVHILLELRMRVLR